MLNKKEKDVLKYYSQNDVALSPRPFADCARALGVGEAEVVSTLNALQKRGFIKNMRAVFDHRKSGYKQNALIAWNIDRLGKGKRTGAVKNIFMRDNRISHFYGRTPHEGFDYNTFTMMHAQTKKEIKDFAVKTAEAFKLDYAILFTEAELKKEKLALGDLL